MRRGEEEHKSGDSNYCQDMSEKGKRENLLDFFLLLASKRCKMQDVMIEIWLRIKKR